MNPDLIKEAINKALQTSKNEEIEFVKRRIDKIKLWQDLINDGQRASAHLGYIEHFGEFRLQFMNELKELKQRLTLLEQEK